MMQSMLRTFLLVGVFALTTVARGDSEIVVTIRYLEPKGTSHSHLCLYREDGKLLRQLTNDNSGQDMDPIFASDGGAIVFTREKPNGSREFWSIDPLGKKLTKLDAAPDWYSDAKSSPAFTTSEEESPESTPTSAAGTISFTRCNGKPARRSLGEGGRPTGPTPEHDCARCGRRRHRSPAAGHKST